MNYDFDNEFYMTLREFWGRYPTAAEHAQFSVWFSGLHEKLIYLLLKLQVV